MALDGGGGRHHGAHEMRAAAAPLPPFEVAVRRRRAALAGTEHIVVHAEAHRAAGVAPLEARLAEDLIEALALGLRLHALRTWDDHRAHTRRDVAPAHDARGRAQVLDARVGARAQKNTIDRQTRERCPGLESHVLERTLGRAPLRVRA